MSEIMKVLIARLGLDAHWRGSIIVAKALRDAGMEVIYLGNKMPEAIVDVALQDPSQGIVFFSWPLFEEDSVRMEFK